MKKKILAVTAAILFTVSATFAKDIKPVPTSIVNELNKEFKNVRNVEWKTTNTFYKAKFTVDGKPLEAFFSFDGNMIGISRNVHVDQLPLNLIKEATEKGDVNNVTNLFELLTDRGTEYYITFGTGKDQKTYKSSGTSWSRFDANTFTQAL